MQQVLTPTHTGYYYVGSIMQDLVREQYSYSIAVAAQAEGASGRLRAFCDEQLAQPLARDRCLAVSLLAWTTGLSPQNRLTRLERDDPSSWVRAHAAWAAQVARRETAAREGYRLALAARTAAEAQTRLEILRPALTWTAGW